MATCFDKIQLALPILDQSRLAMHLFGKINFGNMQINESKLWSLIEFCNQLNEATLEVSRDDARMNVQNLQLASASRRHWWAAPWRFHR